MNSIRINIARSQRFIIFIGLVFFYTGQAFSQIKQYKPLPEDCLANGEQFPAWETAQHFARTYFVDTKNPKASDRNNGTAERPFKTISCAAQWLQPGERVIIKGGIYRECVVPARGGSAPDKMITYEAAPGEKVILSGSIVLDQKRWEIGRGWKYGRQHIDQQDATKAAVQIWQYNFDGALFAGYNPFGMLNLMEDREYLQIQKVNMDAHLMRRGLLFLNGKPIEQVAKPTELLAKEKGAFWVEHNGMRIHVRFPGTTGPKDYLVEATAKEQVFAPAEYGLGYIAIEGITFQHAGNGFPVPQRGMVSTNRGHHWLVEHCTIEWANSVGIDMGNEMWNTVAERVLGYHIVRNNIIRNCGIGGLEAMAASQMLVEDNLFENIGWQNAELAFESGAIKIHQGANSLIRRNVFRHIKYAPGIWMDYLANKNLRITHNVFTDISSARGAIYIEVSRNDCLIDRNTFHQLHCEYWVSGEYGAGGNALYTDGSDSIRFCNNLMLDIENTGYGDYLNAERIVGKRGGVTRWHSVMNNIFIDCRKHAIEFPNEYNYSNGNIFSGMPAGYLKMTNPAPSLLLDLEAWQKLYGWENEGQVDGIQGVLDNRKMELTLKYEAQKVNLTDKGPFDSYESGKKISIDPRKGSASGNYNHNAP
jgi:hypothetical protein